MKNKRIASLLIVLVLMLSTFSSAFAAPYDLKNNLTEATYDILTWSEDAAVLLDVAEAPHKYAIQVGEDFYAADEIIAKMKADPTMTIEDAIVGLTPVDQEPGEGDLEVVEVSAIDSTTIRVLFSDGIESNFTVDPLKDGSNTVKFIYDGVEYTDTVNWVAKAAVENVFFDNYRQIRVLFNTVVDTGTATEPQNYYFEIVEGDVADDVWGAVPTMQDDNHLMKIETGYPGGIGAWFGAGHIFENTVNGKTEVTIQLPEDARFTNRVDGSSTGSFDAALEDGIADDERTLSVKLADNVTLKHLIKNTNLVVSVRNVRNADKIRNIDTSRHEILILDEEKPEIEVMNRVRGTEVTPFTNTVTLLSDGSDHIEIVYDEPVFDAHDLEKTGMDRNVILYINGKYVADTKGTHGQNINNYLEFFMGTADHYDTSRVAKLDVAAAAADALDRFGASAPEPFIDGETLRVRIMGVTDLAGNIQVPSEIQFDVEVEDPGSVTPPVTPTTKPQVLGVKQVTDNIFRVEFNMANATGEFAIENADGEKGEIKGTAYNLPLSVSNGLTGDDERFFSYIVVDAIDVDKYATPPTHDKPVTAEDDILAYDGQTQLDRTVRVRGVWSVDSGKYAVQGDNFKKEMFPIIKDTLAPKLVEVVEANKNADGSIEFDAPSVTSRKLTFSVKDIMPASWTQEFENPVKALIYNYNDNKPGDIDKNTVEGFGDDTLQGTANASGTGTMEYLPIKVSYQKDGVTYQDLLSNVTLPDTTFAVPGAISYDYGTQELTLDLSGYTSLLENNTNPALSELVKGVTYKIEIPKGFFADPDLEDIESVESGSKDITSTNVTGDGEFTGQVTIAHGARGDEDLQATTTIPGTTYTNTPGNNLDFEVLHVSQGRTLNNVAVGFEVIGKGYSSLEQVFRVTIGEKPTAPGAIDPDTVPQTSKELITYDQDTNEMSVEFKGGLIDLDTLKKAANYTINGKTLAAWGTKDSDIKYKQVKDGSDKVVQQFAIFEVPQDSVPQDGDVKVVVNGVKNLFGGTMTKVETEVALLDNTRPVVLKAYKQGDYQIVLEFDEPLEYKELSNEYTAAKNFIVKIDGVEMQGSVLEARVVDGERKVTLQLGIDITATAGEIVVVIVEDASGNINVIDQAKLKNPLKDGYDINVRRD